MSHASHPLFDDEEIVRALGVLIKPGCAFEVRIVEPHRDRAYAPKTISGYFDDPSLVPKALRSQHLTGAKGFYATLNPIGPALLARSYNRFSDARDGQCTADKDILCRRWLLVDTDPVRPAGISSSDAEKALAHERMLKVAAFLREAGWPDPIVADSGNGYHLLYPIDAPVEDDIVKQCLEALQRLFGDETVAVDTSVHNPSRIVKLYGTLTGKGDDCPKLSRPHRPSRLMSVPGELRVVPMELLQRLAAQPTVPHASAAVPVAPPDAAARRKALMSGRGAPWNQQRVQAFIDQHLQEFHPGPAIPYNGGFKWPLRICPFNPDHTNSSAVIILGSDGRLGFKCHHDGCKANNWKALRAKFEPRPATDSPAPQPIDSTPAGDDPLVRQYGSPVLLDDHGRPTGINQLYVAGRHARDNLILHEPRLNQFYDYDADTGLWRPKTEARLLIELAAGLRQLLSECGHDELLTRRTENFLGQILRLLKGVVEKPEAFRRTDPIIHVKNGVLDLGTNPPTLRPFSPSYYSRNRSEICFDRHAKCPLFLEHLLKQALDDDDIYLLQRFAGQCALAQNPSQKLMLLRGTPGGGKSTLANVLEATIGTHNVAQLRVQHLAERFELAGFVGKTLLSGKDVPGDFLNNKSAYVLKALVGGDRLDAEQKNEKHRFELQGEFNVLITSNTRLHLRLDADSGAWRRRLLIVDYERPPAGKPIPNFDRRLMAAEGPGILNWCVEGAVRLLAELETSGAIQLTSAQMKRVDDLLSESDSVRHFVGERVVQDDAADVTVSELQTAYHNFCEDQCWQAVTVRQFEHQVSDIMMEVHRVAKRTDIKRNDRNQRGFARVGLVGAAA